VRTLSARDAATLLAVTAELGAMDDALPFPPHFLAKLAELVPGEVNYSEADLARELFLNATWWGEGEAGSMVTAGLEGGERPDDGRRAYWRLRHQHPTCGYRECTSDWTSVRKVSDSMSMREFRRTEIFNELYRGAPLADWIDVGLKPAGERVQMFVFMNEHGVFDESDRLVLELLQPHLQQRYDRVRAAAEAADAIASIDGPRADDPRHVVLCSRNGVIEYGSPQARRLLVDYEQCRNGHLPESLLTDLARRPRPHVVERNGRRLTVRAARSGELFVLLLGEEDLRLDRLTPRQRVVLERIALGETDSQIGAALGIAPATVNKHLEQIYERLGVHTRTAAAAVARAG
jgi:DNA-binding CsgD family transcriptional regulator